jgi:hypothetical protein
MKVASADRSLVASRNPQNSTTMPASRVTAKAVMAPKTELRVPLLERINVPAAIRALDDNSRRGAALRHTLQALQAAPPKITTAPPADATAARTRGRTPKTREPWAS